jgi:hypothetical protein
MKTIGLHFKHITLFVVYLLHVYSINHFCQVENTSQCSYSLYSNVSDIYLVLSFFWSFLDGSQFLFSSSDFYHKLSNCTDHNIDCMKGNGLCHNFIFMIFSNLRILYIIFFEDRATEQHLLKSIDSSWRSLQEVFPKFLTILLLFYTIILQRITPMTKIR